MDAHQEVMNTDDRSPVLACVVKQFFDHFVEQVSIYDLFGFLPL